MAKVFMHQHTNFPTKQAAEGFADNLRLKNSMDGIKSETYVIYTGPEWAVDEWDVYARPQKELT